MILRDAIDQYIAWRRAHGAELRAQIYHLKLFLKSVDGEVNCDAIATEQVRPFLAGKGPLTQYRSHKYSTLAGFYRYAISRGHATRSPLPALENEPKAPPSAPRHVYSHDELRRLFQRNRCQPEPRAPNWMRTRSARCSCFCMEPVCG